MVPGGRGLGLLTLVLESGGLGSRSLGLKLGSRDLGLRVYRGVAGLLDLVSDRAGG